MSGLASTDTKFLTEARLPESMHEIIRVLGHDPAMRLVEALGGITIPGTTGARKALGNGKQNLLESVLTREEINRLVAWNGGAELYIPRCDAALRAQRNARFLKAFKRAQEEGSSSTLAIAKLCPHYGFSDRYGWELLRRWRKDNAQVSGNNGISR